MQTEHVSNQAIDTISEFRESKTDIDLVSIITTLTQLDEREGKEAMEQWAKEYGVSRKEFIKLIKEEIEWRKDYCKSILLNKESSEQEKDFARNILDALKEVENNSSIKKQFNWGMFFMIIAILLSILYFTRRFSGGK